VTFRPVLADGPPIISARRVIPADWTDYNGHMNEGRFGQLFSDAADAVMTHVGADAAYIAAGNSYFTAETTIKFLSEAQAGEHIIVETRVTQGAGKKLRCYHEMKRESDGEILATSDQFMLHVNLETRRSCDPLPEVLAKVEALAALHKED
jgi:carnitine 3-dehydrogenase